MRFEGDEDAATAALASLWLMCTYGGLGARTRRGFGGLRIVDVDGPLPPPWTPQTLRSPGLDFYQNVRNLWPSGPLGECMRALRRLVQDTCAIPFTLATVSDPPPQYPLLSKAYTTAGLSGGQPFTHWSHVLAHAGEQLRLFRASEPHPGAPYRPPRKTPEWTRSVTGDASDHFPLGALGLPVGYKEGWNVNAYRRVVAGQPGPAPEPLRRASPLWLRPVGADNQWRLLSFAFCGQFLPEQVEVKVRKRNGAVNKTVTVFDSDVSQAAEKWIDGMHADNSFDRPPQGGARPLP